MVLRARSERPAFESLRRQLARRGEVVEDAITGRKLLIERQLLNISMATGDVRALPARHACTPPVPARLTRCTSTVHVPPA